MDDLKNNFLPSAPPPAGIMSGSREVVFLVRLRQKRIQHREEQCDRSVGTGDNLAIFPGRDERTIKETLPLVGL